MGHCGQPRPVDRVLSHLHGEVCGTGVDHILETACPNRLELSLCIDDPADRIGEPGIFHAVHDHSCYSQQGIIFLMCFALDDRCQERDVVCCGVDGSAVDYGIVITAAGRDRLLGSLLCRDAGCFFGLCLLEPCL